MSILKGGEVGRLEELDTIDGLADKIAIFDASEGKLFFATAAAIKFTAPVKEVSTTLQNNNYTVLVDDYRIDFKITTSTTFRATLPDPTTTVNKNRVLVVDNHYASNAGSLVDFSRSIDGVAAGSATIGPDNSLKIRSDGIEWRGTV